MCFTHLRQRRRCHERDCSTARTILPRVWRVRSEEHTSELQSRLHLVCRLLLEKKKTPPPPSRRPRRSDRCRATSSPQAHPRIEPAVEEVNREVSQRVDDRDDEDRGEHNGEVAG